MTAWDLQNGFTYVLGPTTFVRWNQLQRIYYAIHNRHLIAQGTNLKRVVQEARYHA
jgi:hypothetical protein